MVIARSPLRVSLVGGGSDCAWFSREYEGAVISTTIDKYVTIVLYESFDENFVLNYTKREESSTIDGLGNELFREALRFSGIQNGVEVHSMADVPSNTGLGSSSSFCVALLHALSHYLGEKASKSDLAQWACRIEIDILDSPVGKQDQYAAAYGGLNLIRFSDKVRVTPLEVKLDNLMMFYTGLKHSARDIHQKMPHNLLRQRKMVDLAWQLKHELERGNTDAIGECLHESWMLKREFGTSTPEIDDWYRKGLKAGATGGKLLGAGGGGFLLFYVPGDKDKIRREIGLRELKFNLESKGSHIVG